ncbi:MAG: patatin-like phospholipase family protein [Anaerolineae bacterium]|nr:patatin-like phospholipase family protein [Anaerolineae bacterium]
MSNKSPLAFVLSGGGSRGAMQVGALRALFEAGYVPEILGGTSIGAANSAFLALHGCTLESLANLEQVWLAMMDKDLMPTNLWWQTMRAFFRRGEGFSQNRIRDFAIQHGITPEVCFKDLPGIRLFLVASDLNAGNPVVFGDDPQGSLLEGVLASMALPPWLAPIERGEQYLVDGGVVSNLPVEIALQHGAGEIIALDLFDPYDVDVTDKGPKSFLWKLNQTIEHRQLRLEIELAEARGVRVRRIPLTLEKDPVPFWDFRHSPALIQIGYELARKEIDTWEPQPQLAWWHSLVPGWLKK